MAAMSAALPTSAEQLNVPQVRLSYAGGGLSCGTVSTDMYMSHS